MNDLAAFNEQSALLTVKELAEHFGISEKTVRRTIAEAELDPAAIRKGGTGQNIYLYSLDSVQPSPSLITASANKRTGEQFREALQTEEGRAKLEAGVITSRVAAGDITQDQAYAKISCDPALSELFNEMQAQIMDLSYERKVLEERLEDEKAYSKSVWDKAAQETKRIINELSKDYGKIDRDAMKMIMKLRIECGRSPETGAKLKNPDSWMAQELPKWRELFEKFVSDASEQKESI